MRRERRAWIVGARIVVLVGSYFLALLGMHGIIERGISSTLQNAFRGEARITSLQVSTFPYIRAMADGVSVQLTGRGDEPPVITMQRLTLWANPLNLLRLHISGVHIDGLQMRFPPKREGSAPGPKKHRAWLNFPLTIDHVDADNALLETLPRDAKHVAHDFEIQHVELTSFSFQKASAFHAMLTNPVPKGQIDSRGKIGPWDADDPANTAVSGTFVFSHVDFSSIRGLSGTMSSTGKYDGTIEEIDVEGDTEMANFALDFGGNAMPLKTHYVAVVDGSDGNTYLKSVEARLGESPMHVSGEIVGIPGVHGRDIEIDADSTEARAQDVLGLTLKGPAPMTGTVKFHAKIDLPATPEGSPAVTRLSANVEFEAHDMRFTKPDVQSKIDALSRDAQGQPKNQSIDGVPANASCVLTMKNGIATLSDVKMSVTGANLQLNGSFNMQNQQINFHGRLDMDASLSQATTGAKSFFLRLADPAFAKAGGGSSIPFKITGDMKAPSFGLDLHQKKEAAQATAR